MSEQADHDLRSTSGAWRCYGQAIAAVEKPKKECWEAGGGSVTLQVRGRACFSTTCTIAHPSLFRARGVARLLHRWPARSESRKETFLRS